MCGVAIRIKLSSSYELAELAGLLEVGISLLVVVALMLAVVPLIKMLPGLLVDTNEVEISLIIVGHESAVENFISVASIALIFFVRKFLFVPAFGATMPGGRKAPDIEEMRAGVAKNKPLRCKKKSARTKAPQLGICLCCGAFWHIM